MQLLTREAYAALDGAGRPLVAPPPMRLRRAATITDAGSIFHQHMHERPIHGYRSVYAAPTEVRALHQLQQRMLRRGCLISPTDSGFISTVPPLSLTCSRRWNAREALD
jgi:hypothetical protein